MGYMIPDWMIEEIKKQREQVKEERPVLYVPEPLPPEPKKEEKKSPERVIEIQIW